MVVYNYGAREGDESVKRVTYRNERFPFELKGQTSKGRSFQLASCRPPLSTQRTMKAAHACTMSFGFNTAREIISVPHWGSTPKRALEWKLRM
jgi:hypothetical protein